MKENNSSSQVKFSGQKNPQFNMVTDLEPQFVLEKKDTATLIDVRQEDEYFGELHHVPGAKWIVLDELAERLDEIDTSKPVVFICRSGGRSAKACMIAQDGGLENVYNMKGGMLLWNNLQFPTE